MTIKEYISRLSAALSNIDSEEAANVLQYYTEILEDAEDPQAEMAKFILPQWAKAVLRNAEQLLYLHWRSSRSEHDSRLYR